MMGLRNLMLKTNEAADNGLDVTVFSQQSSSVTKPSAVTCKNITELSSFINYWNTAQDIYFPNVQSIYSNAFVNATIRSGTLHFNANYKAAITGSTSYPTFGSASGSPTYVFDINAAKLTIDKSSDVVNLWVDDFAVTTTYEWIPKNKDVSIVAESDTALLVDTVNTPTDLTYTVTMPTSNPIGINLTGVEGTASTSIKYGSKNLTTKTGLNPYLYAPSGTTLNYDMSLTTSDGDIYTYTADLTSLVDITTADMVALRTYFVYDGTTYYVTDTLTTFDDLYSWISSNYSSTYASHMTELYDAHIETFSTSKLQDNSYLSSIYLVKCTSVSGYAFNSCYGLKTVNLPKCTSIGNGAFYFCFNLKTINLPKCTSIGSNAFYSCAGLETVNLPECTSIGSNAFSSCSKLTSIHFAAANQATIEALSGYSSKFGASSATIYFDL